MKKICLVLLVGLFLSLACTRDKNPLYVNHVDINSGGKAVNDMGTFVYLDANGALWTWGLNLQGQAGLGSTGPVASPTEMASLPPILDFDMREGFRIAVDMSGNIWAWGYWSFGGTSPKPFPEPTKITRLPGAIMINSYGYMLHQNGSVWEINVSNAHNIENQTPTRVAELDKIHYISQNLGVTYNGHLVKLSQYNKPPESGGFIPLSNIKQVQNSTSHSVILKTDGSVWAWGNNGIGELGNGTTIDSVEPVKVLGMDNVVQISVRYHFNLALKADGSVWYWGFTAERDADNKPIGIHTPERIETDGPVASIEAGDECMLIQQDGTLWTFHVSDRVVQQIIW